MTILEAAKSVGINIPTLCYLKDINAIGACRICVVEVKGAKTLVTACVYPVNEGMEITTNSARVMDSRRRNLELLLSTHEKKCLSCVRSGNCELQALSKEFGVEDENHFAGEKPEYKIDDSAAQLYRDNNSASCAAAASPYVAAGRAFRSSAPTTAASRPTSAAPLTWIWTPWPASAAASASTSAPPAR